MEIRIIHIDDVESNLQQARDILNGSIIEGHTLVFKDSCNFQKGMELLESEEYDLVILDLCVGDATEQSDKIGEEVFQQIKNRAFIPVIFFTGLPKYVESFKSDVVGVAAKASGYDELSDEITRMIKGGFLELKISLAGMIQEGLRSYFWDFIHEHSGTIHSLQQDQISLRYLLLRRLAKTISSEVTRADADSDFNKNYSHPMEFYIYPIIEGEFENGDILRCNKSNDLYVILTPSCDFVLRKGNTRKAEKILLAKAAPFRNLPDFPRYEQLKSKKEELNRTGDKLNDAEEKEFVKLIDKLKKRLQPGNNDRYFFLPKTPFIDATLVDFQDKIMVSYDELEKMFTTIATISDPIAQSLLAQFTRYYSRIGYTDLDQEYAFSRI